MSVQIGARPDRGFDDPLGMLHDCHRRIERFLNAFGTVARRARGRALDAEETAIVESALQYFRVGGSRHTDDEEVSLFPRLSAHPDAPKKIMDDLEGEHQRAQGLHYLVDRLFMTWMNGTLKPEQEEQLESAMAQLEQLYAGHIEVEEQILFPAAAKLLSRKELAEIG